MYTLSSLLKVFVDLIVLAMSALDLLCIYSSQVKFISMIALFHKNYILHTPSMATFFYLYFFIVNIAHNLQCDFIGY